MQYLPSQKLKKSIAGSYLMTGTYYPHVSQCPPLLLPSATRRFCDLRCMHLFLFLLFMTRSAPRYANYLFPHFFMSSACLACHKFVFCLPNQGLLQGHRPLIRIQLGRVKRPFSSLYLHQCSGHGRAVFEGRWRLQGY